ncbi:MAG: tetratricopeptide repeat protein [Planctomycetota bacterium]|nr:tetratricopeptide repeat protein [Planctomycetota bacterium]
MAAELAEISLPEVFESETIHMDTFVEVRKRVRGIATYRNEAKRILDAWSQIREKARDAESLAIREAFLYFLLGELDEAIPILDGHRENEVASVVLAWSYREKGNLEAAESVLESALSRHSGSATILFALAETQLEQVKIDEANEVLSAAEDKFGDTMTYRFLRVYQQEISGDYDGAMDAYRGLLEESPNDCRVLFRLAYNEDLRGEQEKALELYERCVEQTPIYSNAMVNLGLLYEDLSEYQKAADCYEKILKGDPLHDRARMYHVDAKASMTMYYDEDKQKRTDRRNLILKTPITDFELSVRSRNCLNKMDIRTLGDLIYKTEVELLTYKNFGETSLTEIKDMLSQKNLTLGMKREEMVDGLEQPLDGEIEPVDEDEVSSRPVESLELSGRSRKAIEALGIVTLGDLLQKNETELLLVKNFGYTSLNEVKRKLDDLGLALKD